MKLTAENKHAIILAIDDSEDTLELIKFILLDAGYENIITSQNPEHAVALFLEHNPDVVLLDLNMPGKDGFSVITDLKEHCNAEYLPVIIVTDADDVEVKVRVLQHGAKDYIRKPFDHFELLARTNTIVAMSSFYKELILKNSSLKDIVNEQTNTLMNAVQKQQEAEQLLQKNLTHDIVTGLPNRYLFEDRLLQLITVSMRNKTNVAVIVIGFDNHHEIKNIIGHASYNELFRKITERLRKIIRVSDTVSIIQDATSGTALSRIGDDMFAIIVPIFQTLNDIDKVVGRCAASLLEPIDLPEIMFDVVIRAGVSYFPDHGETADDLIQRANIALYHAREKQNNFMIYNLTFDSVTKYRLNLMTELKSGIKNNELRLFYQPKIDLVNNVVTGCEALLRWQHPQLGAIVPDSFIPMAEKTGTIRLLTIWVIEEAMRQWVRWVELNIYLNISINLSTHDLSDKSLVDMVKRNLEKYHVTPDNIIFEVTESSTMQDPTTSMNTLNHLSALGVKLSIDDYGTGYSSLSYLRSLPVNEIKIDKSFVTNMDLDNDNSVIVRSTIELAHNLGYRVVAEGIENEETYKLLQDYGCDIGQGYYMSRSLPEDRFVKWFLENKSQAV